ncbi:MAG: NAD(P)-binding domain-containing protein [Devosia sp.]
MRIGIIGTGHVATALATGWAGKHEVFLVSRNPAGKSGLPAPVKGYGELASAEVIVTATPGGQTLDILKEIGAAVLNGKIVLDVGNAVDAQFNLLYPNGSLAAKIQETYAGAKVVKAFNTFNTSIMTNPGSLSAPTNAFVSGNDEAAKRAVIDLHALIGWKAADVIDLGKIDAARAQEHYFPLFFAILRAVGGPQFNIAVIR